MDVTGVEFSISAWLAGVDDLGVVSANISGDTSLSDITVVPDAPTASNVAVPAGTVGVAAGSAVATRAAMAAVTMIWV